MNNNSKEKLFDFVDNKFDLESYGTRVNIANEIESSCIGFALYIKERYTYHENFGFRNEEGESFDIEQIFEKYCSEEL